MCPYDSSLMYGRFDATHKYSHWKFEGRDPLWSSPSFSSSIQLHGYLHRKRFHVGNGEFIIMVGIHAIDDNVVFPDVPHVLLWPQTGVLTH